ncbi:hypothetical protein KUV86_15235 [Halomonas sp. DP8Y7-3]|uniref:hypothetical protein n=1 Tax=Halomonas sp. DP8Y7-3 TaxID=2859079 RepID=UPI001C956BE6|nr:hypothetical protein [Halomonas sp. DP8Y7-3]MBY5930463.1 hypothetical protein [Halomonas sp. DP8Y7-3]
MLSEHSHYISNGIRCLISKETHPNIYPFFVSHIHSIESNSGIINYQYIIANGPFDNDGLAVFKRFADDLESNFSTDEMYKLVAFTWVSLDFNQFLRRHNEEQVISAIYACVDEWILLSNTFEGEELEKEWEAFVLNKADDLLGILDQRAGSGNPNFIYGFNTLGVDKKIPEGFTGYVRYALYKILQHRAMVEVLSIGGTTGGTS